jgi:7,8-dihydropterin-6-yl-methyl-4-(beta-D-ribofuranosyl)aminobenzene 5'-phosphate synthase
MRIACLVDDRASDDRFEAEHGLSFYIETKHHKILFDLGQTDLFSRNAKRLGLDLSQVDTVIISHGHYDHGGGLQRFFAINDHATVYINRRAKGAFYSLRDDGMTYIGLDTNLLSNARIHALDHDHVIDQELTVFQKLISNDLVPSPNRSLFERKKDAYVLDAFLHEQNLLITEDGQGILFAGCAHRGIVNIVATAREHLRDRAPLSAVFGGFHMMSRFVSFKPNMDTIESVADRLDNGKTKYFTGHCTGDTYSIFKNLMGDSIERFYPGQVVSIVPDRITSS